MYPWTLCWAPQFHFPFSGGVAQQIEPDISWFFNGIRPEAGNADMEKQAFEVASYGKQLGLMTEVLLSLAGKDTIDKKQAADSLARLTGIYRKIEGVKTANKTQLADTAVALLEQLRSSDPEQFNRIVQRYVVPAEA